MKSNTQNRREEERAALTTLKSIYKERLENITIQIEEIDKENETSKRSNN